MITRRGLLKFLGIGAGVAAAAPVVARLPEPEHEPEPEWPGHTEALEPVYLPMSLAELEALAQERRAALCEAAGIRDNAMARMMLDELESDPYVRAARETHEAIARNTAARIAELHALYGSPVLMMPEGVSPAELGALQIVKLQPSRFAPDARPVPMQFLWANLTGDVD